MRIREGLFENTVLSVHNFIGGRLCYVLIAVLLIHIGFFVYQFGERKPGEPVRLLAELSLQKVGVTEQPHRIFTSPLIQTSAWQLLLTFFMLYLFGWFVLRRLGVWLFLLTYFLSASVSNVVTYELAGNEWAVTGTSGGVISLAFLCATYFPYLRFFKVVSARYAAPFVICCMAFVGAPYVGALVVLSQLAGISVALSVYILEPRLRMEIKKWWLRKQVEKAITEAEEEERLDILLKKVSRFGMSALSRKERNFLMQMSRRYHKKVTNKKE